MNILPSYCIINKNNEHWGTYGSAPSDWETTNAILDIFYYAQAKQIVKRMEKQGLKVEIVHKDTILLKNIK